MSLSPGERLGPYELLEPIGAGGMGEVYRARDTRLDRFVAIKVVHGEGTAESAALRRFEVEMRAVGRLSHPNILAVYDVGTRNGIPFLVTELLEGETLRSRLERGPLPLSKLLLAASDIAAGLASAHAAGVVHRDLKPDNVFVTKDGRIKLLDFGLAKFVAKEPPIGDAETAKTAKTADTAVPGAGAEAPTLSRLTVSGLVVGTVSYMSPEQIKGGAVDHRCDIFAFGTVLFEMLTGHVPFRRGSAIETFSATLSEDPFARLQDPGLVPPRLEPVLRRCLEKDPNDRYQSAADLAFHLRDLSSPATISDGQKALAPAGGDASLPGRMRRLLGSILPGGAAAAALVGVGALLAVAFAAAFSEQRPAVPHYRQLTFRRGAVLSARYAPDGRTVVYGASWEGKPPQLYSMRTESPESRPLDLPSADVLAVSSRGELALSLGRRFVYGFSTRGTLARAPMNGGSPREVLADVEDADWSPDGHGLAVIHVVEGRHRLEYPVGEVLHTSPGWISNVRVAPDGRRVAFIDHPIPGDDRGSICVVEKGAGAKVLSGGWASAIGLAWHPSGSEIWFSATEVSPNCAIWAVTTGGRKRLLARGAGRLVLQDVRAGGEALVTEGRARAGISYSSSGGRAEKDLSWLDASFVSDLSADGTTIVFGEQGAGSGGGSYAVYLRRSDGSPAVRLGEGTAGPLSPDGRYAVSILPTPPQKVVLLPTGTGEPRTLDTGNLVSVQSAAWFPDGARIALAANAEGQPVQVWIADVAGGAPRPLSKPGVRMRPVSGAVSPDGLLVAAIGADDRAILLPVDGGPPRQVPGLVAGETPIRWSADGGSLFVLRDDETPPRILRLELRTGNREVTAAFAPPDPAGIETILYAQVTPDGRAYAYSYFQYRTDLHLLTGLK